ncbi:hypothetical protein EV421DRAFT_1742267 [Armillaria borealis]|uniref:Uncharacterized protein n=1 Tax=Armillaria borealis TaxID=47425 RepID=A0AA39MF41_9AGAR|nr:hypothetical protein EV421DRAFT_1742267 [Armillaria borealis]
MPVSPRRTHSATRSALRNQTTPALEVLPARKGRAVYASKVNISPIQRLHNLLSDALTTVEPLEVTLDNRPTLQNIRKFAVSLLEGCQGTRGQSETSKASFIVFL